MAWRGVMRRRRRRNVELWRFVLIGDFLQFAAIKSVVLVIIDQIVDFLLDRLRR